MVFTVEVVFRGHSLSGRWQARKTNIVFLATYD